MDERKYCVYIHTNISNGKRYVGLTCQSPNERWRNGKGYRGSTHFENAINKYGWDNFSHEIVANNLSKEEACVLENKLILEYKTQDENYGYNLKSGGCAPRHSEETKNKLRELLTGRTFSDETIERMKVAAKKRGGHAWSDEAKQKISQTKMGHEVSEETRDKLRKVFSKKVICIELGLEFPSMTAAANHFGGHKKSVSSAISGRNKTAFGYHWQLVPS